MNKRVSIHCCTKDRFCDVGVLLQSLRTQTYKDWDLILYDQSSPMPIFQAQSIMALIQQIKSEGHAVKMECGQAQGVCPARNHCIDMDDLNNDYILRCDDDCVLEPDYIEKLIKVIDAGYDMATGVVPGLGGMSWVRKTENVKPIINYHEFDKDGNLIKFNDDLGYRYDKEEIIPTPHFRTNCLYKSNKELRYPPFVYYFREEGVFSFKAILDFNYKIGVNTQAVALHTRPPTGGCRYNNMNQIINQDHQSWLNWSKEKFAKHGDFLRAYYKRFK